MVKLSNGIATTITDVTARHQHREDLKSALNFNKSIIASSPFSIIVTDKAGIITSVNPAAEKMLWYKESELIGRNSIELHDQEEIRQRALDLSTQFDTEVFPDHHVFRFAPGERTHRRERVGVYPERRIACSRTACRHRTT